ncbi:MAG: WecB/TagA/CpsF family glycosyltransferase [Pseudomonadaceae bacterium]|nr:WecB/TagA/CpsF family glycosyltransferase [Pseudomonadaceae bacterium]
MCVARLARAEALELLRGRFEAKQHTLLAYANTNLVNFAARDAELAKMLQDFVLLNDGIGLELGARLVNGGEGFLDNLNGTDFTPQVLGALPRGSKVFLYGSKPRVVAKAATEMAAWGVTVVGAQDGYAKLTVVEMVKRINASGAEVVLVALGNPRQELWMAQAAPLLNAILLVGVGALFDFVAGEFRRAPLWVQRLRLEWLFRLVQEPRRLLRRYTWDIGAFLWVVWRWRWD